MGEIPEDIMQAARAALDEYKGSNPAKRMRDAVAKAILAERQRCADVARAYLEDLAGCDLRTDEPELIASAILNP